MDLGTLIGSYGFPIAACIYMATVNNKTMKSSEQAVRDNTAATNKMVELVSLLVSNCGFTIPFKTEEKK